MARRLMAQLGDLLRASLRHTAQPLVTLGDELTFLDDFLAIESARFEGRLHVSVQADYEVLGVRVPSFLLQPLAENAIRHGVGPRLSGGRVAITATGTPATLSLRVRDDGLGLPAEWRFVAGRRRRSKKCRGPVEHIYGRPELLRVVSLPTGGVEVQIDVPREPPDVTRPEPRQ